MTEDDLTPPVEVYQTVATEIAAKEAELTEARRAIRRHPGDHVKVAPIWPFSMARRIVG